MGESDFVQQAMVSREYRIVVEETATGFSAYSPDLLGCVTTGASREETEKNMREAIEFHLEGMEMENK
jgi:predicted RNase H-like HicB family nuclease